VWKYWAHAWEDSGFEIYEQAGVEFVNNEMYEYIGAPARRRLEVRELIDALMQRYYGLEEELEYASEIKRDYIVRIWIEELNRIINLIRRRAVDELILYFDPK